MRHCICVNRCLEKVITDVEDAHEELDDSGHQRQNDGVRRVVGYRRPAELSDEERHDGRRADAEVLGRTQKDVDVAAYERCVEAVLFRRQN